MHRRVLPVLAFASLSLTATAAGAHITLSSPPPRHVEQKLGPCGVGPNDARGPNVTTYQGGETIMVRWTETIDHPGHFRISFDADGHDDFADPAAYDDFYSNPAVLVDEIPDQSGNQVMYEQAVTLPLMSCDNCTLQLIQMMTDKPPYELGGNDLYYQCADIVLEGAAATTGDTTGDETTGDATTGDATSEATTGDATSSGPDGTTGNDTAPTTGGGEVTAASGSSGGLTDTTGGSDSAADPDGDPSGCGCRSSSPGGVGLGALLLLLARRRRRRG